MKNKNYFEPSQDGSRAGKNPKRARREKLKWHPAFIQAMQLELFEYRDLLTFKSEYQLTSEPLRIDLLIIKKPKGLKIEKNIARIFKAENIIEYKSPEDYLSIKDFLKVYAYANLYAAITPGVDFSDITITLIESRYPRKLVKYLKTVRSYKIQKTSAGIYYVSGDYLPIQIIVSKDLSESENLWLNSLRDNLQESDVSTILDGGKERSEKINIDAYIDIILRANPETITEVKNMARRPTLEEVLMEKGWIPEWEERGRKKGREEGLAVAKAEKLTIARNLLAKGSSPEFVSEITGIPMEEIEKL